MKFVLKLYKLRYIVCSSLHVQDVLLLLFVIPSLTTTLLHCCGAFEGLFVV